MPHSCDLKIPRIVLAGATSGVGKTSISCGLLYALQKSGFSVRPFKVGPDYIDPSYLSSIANHEACNLDAWLMGQSHVLKSFVQNSDCDVSVIEGVMGFYDGFGGDSNFASTHHIATITKSPVILVLDAAKTSRSIAATALGFQRFHHNSRIRGVILNKIGSKKHESLCRQALQQSGLPVLGVVYKNPELNFGSQHLGLIPATQKHIQKKIRSVSKIVADSLDVNKIIDILKAPPSLPKIPKARMKKPKITIAVALDDSFNFYYRDNLISLQREGAILQFFSPTRDRQLPQSDGIYIGGGFPEILGGRLARNHSMRDAIKRLSEDGIPIYAECGGLMYLTKSIDYGGKKHTMIGVFDAQTKMTKKMKLNYTMGRAVSKSIISAKQHAFRGHEFHYSELCDVSPDCRFAYELNVGAGIKDGRDGMMINNTLASFGHLYFDSSDYSRVFLKHCQSFSRC